MSRQLTVFLAAIVALLAVIAGSVLVLVVAQAPDSPDQGEVERGEPEPAAPTGVVTLSPSLSPSNKGFARDLLRAEAPDFESYVDGQIDSYAEDVCEDMAELSVSDAIANADTTTQGNGVPLTRYAVNTTCEVEISTLDSFTLDDALN